MTSARATLEQLRINPDWAKLPLFDRSKWKRVRFGDVVKVLKEQVDPSSGEVDRYVAGEHMETENVHIRTWGTVGDGYLGPAFIRLFRKGQVLYGSRRTYLKKVAVAEWDGVTSNTTLVLEAVEGKLLQELLPWLMLSERFTRHSVAESKGSTNPYINWPDIAKFEFDLPPLAQQRRIAEILLTLDKSAQAMLKLERDIQTAYEACVDQFFFAPADVGNTGLFRAKWKVAQLQDVVEQNAPIRYGIVQVGAYCETGIPTVAIKNLDGDFGIGLHRSEPKIEARYANSRVKPGDVLLSIKATVGEVAIVPESFEGNISRDIARIRCGDRIRPGLLFHLLRSRRYRGYIKKFVVGSTRKEISIHLLRRFAVPIVPDTQSEVFLRRIEALEVASESVRSHADYVTRLRNLINNLTN